MSTKPSYSQILKSSSIIGGAQCINYAISLFRTKAIAVFLGPSGVGLAGLYTATTELMGVVTRLGLNSSGVREIAEAHSSADPERGARAVKVLRRACWATGFFGWILMAVLSVPLSRWVFNSRDQAVALALLGITLLFASINGGQLALLQGTRRIRDLARLSMVSALVNAAIGIAIYAYLGEKGIVPVLMITALINLAFSWKLSSTIPVQPIALSWSETWDNSKRFIYVGIAFMYGAVLTSLVALATRSLILRDLGITANGMYQSAWAISGMFAAFVLQAMGADFYPRLTAVSHDHAHVNRLVNEQTEIGILLVLPGLLGTLAFAPWVIKIFYSQKFLPAAELLPWFVLGIFGRVVSWPIGFIQLAKGASRWLFFCHTHAYAMLMILTIFCVKTLGLVGAAVAFALLYPLHTFVSFRIARHLTGFAWSREVLRLLSISGALIVIGFLAEKFLPSLSATLLGAFLTALACCFSLRGIAARLGRNHRLVRRAVRLPGLRLFLAAP